MNEMLRRHRLQGESELRNPAARQEILLLSALRLEKRSCIPKYRQLNSLIPFLPMEFVVFFLISWMCILIAMQENSKSWMKLIYRFPVGREAKYLKENSGIWRLLTTKYLHRRYGDRQTGTTVSSIIHTWSERLCCYPKSRLHLPVYGGGLSPHVPFLSCSGGTSVQYAGGSNRPWMQRLGEEEGEDVTNTAGWYKNDDETALSQHVELCDLV